jgi:hypothetical protein
MSSENKQDFSSIKLEINDEGGNSITYSVSTRTTGLQVTTRTPESEIEEMSKTPEKYGLVSEETFFKFIGRSAPFLRKYQNRKYTKTFKERFEDQNFNPEYLKFFEEEDLICKSLELPDIFYDRQRAWFVFFKPDNRKDVIKELNKCIKLFMDSKK